MPARFHAAELATAAGDVFLDGAEAVHLARVLRAKVGDRVVLFDGAGTEADAEVAAVGKREAVLRLLDVRHFKRPKGLTLAVALPKGDRAEWLVEKATELGVGRIVPLHTSRQVAEPKNERLARAALEACKQCGRAWLPEISAAAAWRDFATAATDVRWLLHPVEGSRPAPGESPDVAAIGPEGGWTDEELAIGVAAGWRIVSVPGTVWRIETAALAVAARAAWRTAERQEP